MAVRRLSAGCLVALVVLIGTSCSSGGTAPQDQHGPTTTTTTTTTTTAASTTTTSGVAASGGTTQSATGPSGQMLTITAGDPQHQGASLGGPPGSWALGLIVKNVGPGAYQLDPASQVTVVAGSGTSYAHTVGAAATATTGRPTTLAAGQEVRDLLIFVLPSGSTPKTVVVAPFGPTAAALHWTV